MFALLALGGDLGCSGGPTVVGIVSDLFGEDLRKGILAAALFPILLLILAKNVPKSNHVKTRNFL